MDTDLYKFQQQNFLTLLSYYNKTKEKAEKYYFYIQKYKEYTSQYLTQIKNLYNDYSPSISDKSLYDKNYEASKDDEDLEDINKNIFDIEDIKYNKNIFDMEEIKDNKNIFDMEDIKYNKNIFDIEDIKYNKNIFDMEDMPDDNNQNNPSFININRGEQSNNFDLSPLYKLTNIIFMQFLNQINGLNLFLKEIDIMTENFKKSIEKIKTQINKLKLEYLDIKQSFFREISDFEKNNNELLENYSKIENKLTQFCILRSNEYSLLNNKNKKSTKELEELLNKQILDVVEKETNFIKENDGKKNYYMDFGHKSEECLKNMRNNVISIIENIKLSISKFLTYYINYYHINYEDISENLKKLEEMKNEVEYEEVIKQKLRDINDDRIGLTYEKNMTKKYDLNILNNESIIKNNIDKLIKNGYNFNNKNLKLSENDKYYIIKQMCNFSLVNKEKFDIDKINGKLMILKWFETLIINKDKDKENENTKLIDIITEDDLYQLIEIKDIRLYFLALLSKRRTDSKLELNENLFNIFIKIFNLISDKIQDENDLESANYSIILSQTFYKVENEEKIYIINKICNHPIYQKDDFWREYLKYQISGALKEYELNEKNSNVKIVEKGIEKRNNDLFFSHLITASGCMRNYELKEEKIIDILTPLFDTYKISPQNKNSILNFIKNN